MRRATGWRASPDIAARSSGPLAAGIAVVGAVAMVGAITLWAGRAPGWAFDFEAYYAAAVRLIASGSPYQPELLAGPFQPIAEGMYLYSPVPAMGFTLLTAFARDDAALVWLVVKLVTLVAACAVMPVSARIRLASAGIAALSFPVLYDTNLGNVSTVVTSLSIVGWRLLDHPAGGAAVALASFLRPTTAITGLAVLVSRSWRAVLGGLAAGAVLVAVSLPFVGVAGWLDFMTLLRNVSGTTGLPRNADLASAMLALGAREPLPTIALLAGGAIAVVAVIVAARRDRELGYVVAAVAGLLIAPVLWAHYATQLLIPAAFLAHRGRVWALGLPLLAWLPAAALPFVVVAALLLPFLAVRADAPGGLERAENAASA